MIKPNTFLIGAQKSATTSVYNWLSQHPDICGPSTIKDYPFFIKDEFFNKGIESLEKEYVDEGYSNQKITLQGNVQYMFDEKAIDKIHEFDPNAKLICVLRNPVDRAISAFKYFKKLNLEQLSLKEALEKEEERLNGTFQQKYDLTYKAHGLYALQIKRILKKYSKEQVLVLLYEEVRDNPENTSKKAFEFLGVDSSFKPEFKILNATGEVRYKLLQKIFFNKSKTKKFIVDNIVDPILPLHRRTKIRWAFSDWNTKRNKNQNHSDSFTEEKIFLKDYFKNDIIELEKLLNRNLDVWKK